MKILGTGLQGLIGSRVVDLLSPSYTFENVSRSTGVDITNEDQIKKAIEVSDADVVLHLAAKADVDGCEKDKGLGEAGEAWQINVEGTRNVAKACEAFGKKLVYISTDFVFDGEKEFYTETDTPHPLNWYALTKYEGEKIVGALSTPKIIMRVAYPYRNTFPKNDFVRAIKAKLEKNESVSMVTDHIMTPTFVDDYVHVFAMLVQSTHEGIYHVVGSQFISPFDAAVSIANVFGYDKALIHPTTRADFFVDRAPRPFCLALKNDKIGTLGAQMKTFEQGLQEVKKQL